MRRVEKLFSDPTLESYTIVYGLKKKKVFDIIFHLLFAKGRDEYEVILTRTHSVFINNFLLRYP